jgi:dCMP deaminase
LKTHVDRGTQASEISREDTELGYAMQVKNESFKHAVYIRYLCSLFEKMPRITFDDIYMELAQNLSRKSHCVKIKVGAVLTRDTRIISLGYNGPPAGTHNCDEEWRVTGCPRDRKGGCSLAIHAEENAILYAAKSKVTIEGATLYVTLSPCLACARIIYTTGIKKVLYLKSYSEYKNIDVDEGVDFLKKFGVRVEQFVPQNFSVEKQ